jgi:hypothetical protein
MIVICSLQPTINWVWGFGQTAAGNICPVFYGFGIRKIAKPQKSGKQFCEHFPSKTAAREHQFIADRLRLKYVQKRER